jgi:hypothetical protein
MKLGVAASFALTGALALTGVLAIPGSAQATLHGFCNTSDSGCVDNGTNTPTTLNPPQFGFSAGGHSATGDVMLDILVPDTISNPSTTYTISGPLISPTTFTASLFSTTAWTSGQLKSYLGISANQANPIGAYLPTTQTFQPSATGFFVYDVNIGNVTLPSNSGAANSDLLTLNKGLLQGSYVVAFITEANGGIQATANSGAILETGHMPSTPEPSTWAMMLIGFAGLGFAGYRKAHSARTALSAA